MTASTQIKNIYIPAVFHRDYENDFLKKDEIRSSALKQCLRITQVALPFISLYKPLGQPLSVVLGSTRVISSAAQMIEATLSGNSDAIGKTVLETAIAAAALACSIFAHPLGMIVTTAHDMTTNITQLIQAIENEDYKKAAEMGLHLTNNALYLGCFFVGSLEWSIASIGVQLLLASYNSGNEFKKGNYLEGCGHLLMAGIRAEQLHGQVQLLQFKQASEKVLSATKTEADAKTTSKASASSQITLKSETIETNNVMTMVYNGLTYHVAEYENGTLIITCLDGQLRGYQAVYADEVIIADSTNVTWFTNYFLHRYSDGCIYSYQNKQSVTIY